MSGAGIVVVNSWGAVPFSEEAVDEGNERSMTMDQLKARWKARRAEWAAVGAQVDGALVCETILSELEFVEVEDDILLNLSQAAQYGGYSREYLGRLVKAGKVPNAGKSGRPLIRRKDAPTKPGYLPSAPQQLYPTTLSSKERIVRSVIGDGKGA